jgi:hypothetical protein
MGTVEIITIGGGQHVVAVMNAVAAWTGGGGFRGLLQVVMVIGLAYALLTMAMNLNWKVLYQWFVASTLMYACLIVPTTTVVITDKINPSAGNGSVANVPVGLLSSPAPPVRPITGSPPPPRQSSSSRAISPCRATAWSIRCGCSMRRRASPSRTPSSRPMSRATSAIAISSPS